MSANRKRGFVLLTFALGSTIVFGAVGMAVDVGRLYIVKNELQTFADAASVSAALRLNGDQVTGIARAKNEVAAMRAANRFHLGTTAIPEDAVTLEFGESVNNAPPMNWTTDPGPATNYNFARVGVTVDVPVYFMPIITARKTARVVANATAGQLPATSPQSYFPFTPIAHSRTKPDFGFIPGQQYTLKWASSPKLGHGNVCDGDAEEKWLDLADKRGAQNRGYFGEHVSASELWDQVANDAPTTELHEGDQIALTGGAKTSVKKAVELRVKSDGDVASETFSDYAEQGWTRRIITVPVTDAAANNEVVGFARFFLLTADNYKDAQGNEPWCAEYIGPAVEGGDSRGASTSASLSKVRIWK